MRPSTSIHGSPHPPAWSWSSGPCGVYCLFNGVEQSFPRGFLIQPDAFPDQFNEWSGCSNHTRLLLDISCGHWATEMLWGRGRGRGGRPFNLNVKQEWSISSERVFCTLFLGDLQKIQNRRKDFLLARNHWMMMMEWRWKKGPPGLDVLANNNNHAQHSGTKNSVFEQWDRTLAMKDVSFHQHVFGLRTCLPFTL